MLKYANGLKESTFLAQNGQKWLNKRFIWYVSDHVLMILLACCFSMPFSYFWSVSLNGFHATSWVLLCVSFFEITNMYSFLSHYHQLPHSQSQAYIGQNSNPPNFAAPVASDGPLATVGEVLGLPCFWLLNVKVLSDHHYIWCLDCNLYSWIRRKINDIVQNSLVTIFYWIIKILLHIILFRMKLYNHWKNHH